VTHNFCSTRSPVRYVPWFPWSKRHQHIPLWGIDVTASFNKGHNLHHSYCIENWSVMAEGQPKSRYFCGVWWHQGSLSIRGRRPRGGFVSDVFF
jgi:hypothetical protein